ncbi:MAG: GGDEF domain-containing protein [Acidobacteriota bacterium]|nr:GGDEF domain-containing protein [Acidobacteriota bacterium]
MNYPAPALIEPRLIAAAGAAIVAGLLFLLYLNRRRTYVFLWILGWLLIAGGMVLLGDQSRLGGDLPRFAGVYQTTSVLSALAFAISASAVGGTLTWTMRHTIGAVLLGGWLAFGTPAFGATGALVPGYLVAATALGAASLAFARVAKRDTYTGAGLMAIGFGIVTITNLWMIRAVALVSPEIALRLLALNFVSYAIVALGMHLLIFEDTTKELRLANKRLELAREELRDLALTDALTGAYNRRFFDEIIARELERHRRSSEPLSVVFIDIDKFKTVNDEHGHSVGDTLLRDVCEFLKRKLRETDYVFRWGGDEFVVLMSCPVLEASRRMAALEAEYEAAPLVTALGGGVGLSIGCAEAAPGTKDINPVIAAADADMYMKKPSRIR